MSDFEALKRRYRATEIEARLMRRCIVRITEHRCVLCNHHLRRVGEEHFLICVYCGQMYPKSIFPSHRRRRRR